ncbi:MAG: class I SAM-dependent methyltransferase [Clostridium celatum]|nr:class I SAM-dependent methyltransferase [Clostridium celatum]
MSYNSIYDIIGFNNEVNRLETQAKLGWKKEFRTLKWLGLKDGMRILDVGCGTGVYTELLLENLPHTSITALEVDKKLIDISKKRLDEYIGDRVDLKCGSIMNSGLKEDSFDFIICRFVFQHLDNPMNAAREIYKLLKPGGIVAIIDSDRGMHGVSDPDMLFKSGRGFINQLEKRAGWNREIGRKLIKILKYNGFEKLDFEAVTIHSDLVGIKNIIGNNNVPPEIIKMVSRNNPRLAKIMKICSDSSEREKCTIIFLNLIAKGQKPNN